MRSSLRRALTAVLLIVPMAAVSSTASASANTPPTCSQTESTSFPVAAIQTGGAQAPTNVDFVGSYCSTPTRTR